MIKTILLIIMYNLSSGEVVSVYEQQGKLPGFESQAQCEETIAKDLPNLIAPDGYGLKAVCITPK